MVGKEERRSQPAPNQYSPPPVRIEVMIVCVPSTPPLSYCMITVSTQRFDTSIWNFFGSRNINIEKETRDQNSMSSLLYPQYHFK